MKTFWTNKKVLVTGHSGFKGSWLSYLLLKKGAEVCGVSLPPKEDTNLNKSLNLENHIDENFYDVCDYANLHKAIERFNPEIVFHMAAQAFVRDGYRYPISTFNTNVMGTVNTLHALRDCNNFKVGIFITTDKVYKESKMNTAHKEDDPLGGRDPYSASKSASEFVINCYKDSFFADQDISISTVRAGNVIGGGDWSNDRIIPDAIKNWTKNTPLEVRNPNAVRPWQHVLEPLFGYLKLAQLSYNDASFSSEYNFGPDPKDVYRVIDVVDKLKNHFVDFNPIINITNNDEGFHESDWLSLDNTKSKNILAIEPVWDIDECIKKVGKWYSGYYHGECAQDLCDSDVNDFEARIDV